MANNRLYIVDTATGEKFMLLKSLGNGWYARADNPGEPSLAERLEQWCDGRDPSSYWPHPPKTSLMLICENDPEFE